MTTLTKSSLLPDVPSFFSDVWDEDLWPTRMFGNQYRLPAANVIEHDNDFMVELAVPGMNKKDFKIDIENGNLKISSEKKFEKEEKEEDYTRKEFSYNSFMRTFSLPETVDADKIKANYVDGILKLTLPKKEIAKKTAKRKIAIS